MTQELSEEPQETTKEKETVRGLKETVLAPFRIAQGMLTTLSQTFRKPVTTQYPEIKRPVSQRFRGLHQLKRYENGLERCIGCALCAAACPADAIFVEAGENSDQERYSPGERYARVYEINMIRCIFCGYCEDACPTNAIVLENEYEIAGPTRQGLIYTKEILLIDPPSPDQDTPRPVEPGTFDRSILPLVTRFGDPMLAQVAAHKGPETHSPEAISTADNEDQNLEQGD